jgi:outer membrane protein OmpA-like peptidoglycan-associated protein
MRICKHLIMVILILFGFQLHAQNKAYDWGTGLNAGIYSYSALLESKLTNPYEYSIGSSISVSRYLTHNFNLSLEGMRTKINFPINLNVTGEPLKYTSTYFYGANFTLKYKIDNGYIIKEHSQFAPYFLVGGGAYMTELNPNITYVVPIGAGIDIHLGNRTSLAFESLYNRDMLGGDLSYMQHNVGVKVHFGKANKKRVTATKQRNRSRQLAKIRKYREEQRIAQARKAKEKLKELQTEGLVNNIPTMEEDQDLLMTDENIAMRPDEQPAKAKVVTTPPSKPKEANLGKKSTTIPVDAEPVIPVSPGKPAFEEPKPILADSKPPIPKPSSSRPEITETIAKPAATKPAETQPITAKPETPKPTATKPAETQPITAKPETPKPAATKPAETKPITAKPETPKPVVVPVKPTAVTETANVVTTAPERPQTPEPIKETDKVCQNKERQLSEIGEKIIFEKDHYRIRSTMHWDLRKIELLLNECPKYSYVIIAHTDSDGNAEYNKKLSAKRAEAVKAYLVSKGIDASRLITIPYGASVPIAPNTSDANKAKNRRIEFRLNRTSFED